MTSKSKEIKDLIKTAQHYRSMARTFRSSVGVAFQMWDGKAFGGFNMETYGHKGLHAEEVGIVRALAEGYNGTDFRRMVEIFQDAGHNEIEIFPGCFTCWAAMWEWTHPYLEIIVADAEGNSKYSARLKDMVSPAPPVHIYPSNKIREIKPKINFVPKLPLNAELKKLASQDIEFDRYCKILRVKT